MYTIVKAIGVPFGLNKRWEIIDLAAMTVAQLHQHYRVAEVELLALGADTSVYLDLESIITTSATYSHPLAQFLIELGNTSLPTVAIGAQLHHRTAHAQDAYKSGYAVTPITMSDVLLSRSDVRVDYDYLHTRCLVNVNGFYHVTQPNEMGLRVINANKSLAISHQNQIAFLNFAKLGSITQVRPSPNQINISGATAFVDLGVDLRDKTVFVVISGYLCVVDTVVITQVSATSFAIDFDQLPLLERYYEASEYLDLSSITQLVAPMSPLTVTPTQLTEPATIRAWLGLSQSFFVILDCAEVYLQKQTVMRTGIPNQYITYTTPRSPLVLPTGRQPPYWVVTEQGQYGITIYNNPHGTLLFDTARTPAGTLATPAVYPDRHQPQAYFLEIGTDVQLSP